jgi:MFS family permease
MTSSFSRDRLTWLAYLMLAYYAYASGIFGPLMPFLRAELSLNYTLGGLHLTFFAGGMMITGLFGSALAERWGRKRLLWGGSFGIALGGLALALGPHVILTLLSALLMGISGAIIQFVVQAILSDQHGSHRPVALTEANIGASLSSTLAPLLVSLFTRLAFFDRTPRPLGEG